MEPQVSQASWRAPYPLHLRLLILYLSIVKKELLTTRKGYLIIDIGGSRWNMVTRERLPVTRNRRS